MGSEESEAANVLRLWRAIHHLLSPIPLPALCSRIHRKNIIVILASDRPTDRPPPSDRICTGRTFKARSLPSRSLITLSYVGGVGIAAVARSASQTLLASVTLASTPPTGCLIGRSADNAPFNATMRHFGHPIRARANKRERRTNSIPHGDFAFSLPDNTGLTVLPSAFRFCSRSLSARIRVCSRPAGAEFKLLFVWRPGQSMAQ